MKLKYYLRGLGIGIIVTTIVLMISFSSEEETLSDGEIIARAAQLGMIMPGEDTEQPMDTEDRENTETEQGTEQPGDTQAEQGTEQPGDTQAEQGTEQPGDTQAEQGTEQPGDTQAESREPFRLVVNQGDVCRTVCENLAMSGVIDDPEGLRRYLLEAGYASSISVGTYEIPYGLSFEEITEILQAGPLEKQ